MEAVQFAERSLGAQVAAFPTFATTLSALRAAAGPSSQPPAAKADSAPPPPASSPPPPATPLGGLDPESSVVGPLYDAWIRSPITEPLDPIIIDFAATCPPRAFITQLSGKVRGRRRLLWVGCGTV